MTGVASEIAAVRGVADEGENFFEGGFELLHDLVQMDEGRGAYKFRRPYSPETAAGHFSIIAAMSSV